MTFLQNFSLISLASYQNPLARLAAKAHGLPAEPDTRCFAYNAGEAAMIRILQFGSTIGGQLVPV